MQERGRLRLKRWVRDQDLRVISHLGLEAKAKRMRIEEGEAVLFTNSTLSRARMIIVNDGLPLLIMFPAVTGYQVLSRLMIAALTWTTRNCKSDSDTARSLGEVLPPGFSVMRAA